MNCVCNTIEFFINVSLLLLVFSYFIHFLVFFTFSVHFVPFSLPQPQLYSTIFLKDYVTPQFTFLSTEFLNKFVFVV